MNIKKILITGAITGFGIYVGHMGLNHMLKTDNSDAKLNQSRIGYTVPINLPGEANYSKYIQENEQEFYKIKRDLNRYDELKNIPGRSEKLEAEYQAISKKIESEYGTKIKDFGLNIGKAKLADLHKVDLDDIGVWTDLKDSENVYVKNKVTDKIIMNPSSKMAIRDLLLIIAKHQKAPLDADNAYKIMAKTVQVANNTYKLTKDGKNMMETSMNLQNNKISKEVEEEIR